jgi:hypothetical protein
MKRYLSLLCAFTLTLVAPAQIQQPRWEPIPEMSFRVAPAMAYDPVRQRVVLFGGRHGNGFRQYYLQDTWEWDGTAWHARQPAHKPPGRMISAMAFDPVRGNIILFGGGNASASPMSDTWEWDGRDWRQIAVAAPPPARWEHRMVTDSVRRRIVLFGGSNGWPLTDTWEWDGTSWAQIHTLSAPFVGQPGLAYDAVTQRTILFGGGRDDTWAYDGTNWTQLHPTVRPPKRSSPTLVPHPSKPGRLLMYGGEVDSNTRLGDLWEWDGANWSLLAATSPPGLWSGMRGVLDEARAEAVYWGGIYQSGSIFQPSQDTWVYDAQGWRRADLPIKGLPFSAIFDERSGAPLGLTGSYPNVFMAVLRCAFGKRAGSHLSDPVASAA